MSRDITEDLECDEARAERMDALFDDVLRLHRPDDHASRIVALADAEAIVNHEIVD
ncbi:MAG: hypothetical protein WCQ16_06810 [Verrucomicrobiae bacterium]